MPRCVLRVSVVTSLPSQEEARESSRAAQKSGVSSTEDYLREPARGFFSLFCRAFLDVRFGLLMRNVPLPRFSDD
jgi:hypothetical protein